MSSIHYFQRYNHKENVVTNNTLLLFSRLYRYSPLRFQGFLDELLEKVTPIEVGVKMEQQKRLIPNTVPDGFINQESFKVVIETKLHENFNLDQLIAHLETFGEETTQILLSLSPTEIDSSLWSDIKKSVDDYNRSNRKRVFSTHSTFETIIKSFKNTLLPHDFEMRELIEDYEGFCIEEDLLPLENYRMRGITSGWSLPENFEFGIYYDHESRGFQKHRYIGLYSNKSIVGIGEIENVVRAKLLNGQVEILEKKHKVTEEQKDRVKGIISMAHQRNEWNIESDHRFFIVSKFYETNFPKITKFPIQRTRYFDLRDELGFQELPSTPEIAELLRHKYWE